jgi:hypothetical protein
MDWTKAISNALMMPMYQVANPTTTPADLDMIIKANQMLPKLPDAVVRVIENRPDINGMVKFDDPGSIWISRQGTNWKSKNPWRVAGTIAHENAHLAGANEAAAQRAQIDFLKKTRPKMSWKEKGYMQLIQDKLSVYEDMEKRGLLSAPTFKNSK